MMKDIKGFEGYYQITDDGSVYSTNTYRSVKPGFRKQYLGRRGYLVVDLMIRQFRKNCKVHRLVAEAFLPNPDNKPVVNHIDGDKLNNHVSNLEWCSYKENSEHAVRSGLYRSYNHMKARKLTPSLAVAIYNEEGFHRVIAEKYKIGVSTVTHIKNGTRWGKYTKSTTSYELKKNIKRKPLI